MYLRTLEQKIMYTELPRLLKKKKMNELNTYFTRNYTIWLLNRRYLRNLMQKILGTDYTTI